MAQNFDSNQNNKVANLFYRLLKQNKQIQTYYLSRSVKQTNILNWFNNISLSKMYNLNVQIIKAILTRKTDLTKQMDPYVQLKILEQSNKTKVLNSKGDMPQWNQTLTLKLQQLKWSKHLFVTVKDQDTLTDDIIGQTFIQIYQSTIHKLNQPKWYSLKFNKKPAGKIMIKISIDSFINNIRNNQLIIPNNQLITANKTTNQYQPFKDYHKPFVTQYKPILSQNKPFISQYKPLGIDIIKSQYKPLNSQYKFINQSKIKQKSIMNETQGIIKLNPKGKCRQNNNKSNSRYKIQSYQNIHPETKNYKSQIKLKNTNISSANNQYKFQFYTGRKGSRQSLSTEKNNMNKSMNRLFNKSIDIHQPNSSFNQYDISNSNKISSLSMFSQDKSINNNNKYVLNNINTQYLGVNGYHTNYLIDKNQQTLSINKNKSNQLTNSTINANKLSLMDIMKSKQTTPILTNSFNQPLKKISVNSSIRHKIIY